MGIPYYEAYAAGERGAPVARQLPWTHHLIILSRAKQAEERELERQIKSGRFAETVLNPPIVTPLVS